jgi:hypothetical protein
MIYRQLSVHREVTQWASRVISCCELYIIKKILHGFAFPLSPFHSALANDRLHAAEGGLQGSPPQISFLELEHQIMSSQILHSQPSFHQLLPQMAGVSPTNWFFRYILHTITGPPFDKILNLFSISTYVATLHVLSFAIIGNIHWPHDPVFTLWHL